MIVSLSSSIRIPYEEEILIECYKTEYVEYSSTTFIGIPFVYGVKITPSSSQSTPLPQQQQQPQTHESNNIPPFQSKDSPQVNGETHIDEKID